MLHCLNFIPSQLTFFIKLTWWNCFIISFASFGFWLLFLSKCSMRKSMSVRQGEYQKKKKNLKTLPNQWDTPFFFRTKERFSSWRYIFICYLSLFIYLMDCFLLILSETQRYRRSYRDWKSKPGETKEHKSQGHWCKSAVFFLLLMNNDAHGPHLNSLAPYV